MSRLKSEKFITGSASDVWTSLDVSSVSEKLGYLVSGMSFGRKLGLDFIQDVEDYSTQLPCLNSFSCFYFF